MEDTGRLIRLVAIGLAVAVVLAGVFIFASRRDRGGPLGKVREVTVAKGEVSITLTREGALTVRTPEGTFQQQWDDERSRNFFERFEREDFSQFEGYDPSAGGYVLTIITEDGREITIVIPFLDIPIPDSIEELIETLEEVTGGTPTPTPIFQPTSTPTPGFGYPTPTPTPTPPIIPPTPTPTPPPTGGSGYSGGGDYKVPFICEFLGPDIRPDILSETLCTP